MTSHAKKSTRHNDYRYWASLAIAFGVGITFSCFCPEGLVLFIAAVIITALGIVVLKH